MIPWARPKLEKNDLTHLNHAFKSNWISGGQYINKLENILKKILKAKNVLVTSSGTAAIHLAYLAIGLKKGNEIIVPGYGYLAAANISLQMGLKPIFVDVDLETFCVTSKDIEKKITPKTKLIVVFNIYGNVCDLDPIIKIAKIKKIPVLEDAAESFGSLYKSKQSGTLADIGTYSFQATKTITTGEGGMVVTNKDKHFIGRLKAYRNHGVKDKKYYHYLPGHNFRLTNIQAAIGCAQLKKISKIIKELKNLSNG